MMYLPELRNSKKKYKSSIIAWKGLNRQALIDDAELSSTTNMSTKNFPLLSPRPSRETVYTLSGTGWALGSGAQLFWVDGTNFKYNTTTKGAVTAAAKSMVDFNGAIYIMSDSEYYNYGTDTYGTWGTGTYPAAGSVPAMDYMAVLNNRVWGVKADNIYACALGDATDWTTFSTPSEATDAYSVDTGTQGSFTGIAAYRGTILAFKNDITFKMFGDIPENFQFIHINQIGCISHKSIAEVNGVLFYLGRAGVYAYTGGQPELISENLNDTYSSAVAGGDGRRYYISLYNGSAYRLYVYDTWTGVWLQEDTLQVKDFTYFNGYLYALAADNKIWKFNSGSESVPSTIITKEFTAGTTNKKGYSQINIRADLETGAALTVSKRVDNGSFVAIKSAYATTDLASFRIPIKITRCDHFQIKIEGTGDYKIHALEAIYEIGSDIAGGDA